MAAKSKEFDPQVISTFLMGCVGDTMQKMFSLSFTKDPEMVQKDIVEYGSRLRTPGLSKFNGPCYVAAINYYMSPKALEDHDAIGVLVLYVDYEAAPKFAKGMGITDLDDDDDATLIDAVGELCNVIAGQFKNELTNIGYKDLTISAPVKGKNEIVEGVQFNYGEYKYYEFSFYLWKTKAIVVDITMAHVPQTS